MPPPIPGDAVRVAADAKDDFFRRHRRDAARADDVWRALVERGPRLRADTSFGPVFQPPVRPAWLRHIAAPRVIKGLPHGFRAVYAVFNVPSVGLVVQIEWIGDHKEYDALFGYATS